MAKFDRVANIYDSTRNYLSQREVMGPTVEAMANELANCNAIVDVGVGTGRFAKPLHDRGFNVVGVDISLAMMEKARENGLRDLVRADVHRLPFQDGSFDASIVILVLHIVQDWITVVREMARVCKGIVISLVGRTEGPTIRKEYLRLRKEAGYSSPRFDDGEEGLRQLVPPLKLVPISDAWVEVDADDRILYFERRESSITWDVSDDVHQSIVGKLRTMYGGRILRARTVDELAVWGASQFKELGH